MNVVKNTSVTKSKPIIAVDIDDVLADFVVAMVNFSNEHFKTNLTTEDYDENWAKMWHVSDAEAIARRTMMKNTEMNTTLKPLENAYEVLEKLTTKFEIVALTSRPEDIARATAGWTEMHFPHLVSRIVHSNFWSQIPGKISHSANLTKGNLAQEIGTSFLIDDQPKHANSFAELGGRSLLFGDYGWNRDAEIVDGVTRVADWGGVADYFGV